MKRYIKIITITAQHVLEYKGRIFVWFLTSLISPMLLLLFWGGLTSGNKQIQPGWNISVIVSYYLLIALFDSVLMSHIEEDISREDVQQGDLVGYLLKPISYYWKKFTEEIPYRIIQGSFALILILCVTFFTKYFFVSNSLPILFFAFLSCVLGLFLSFSIKMILGLLSLWLVEIQGAYQFFDILNFVFGGLIVPLFLLPKQLELVAYFLPFSYIIYFPVVILQGKFSLVQLFLPIIGQMIWLLIFGYMYRFIWKMGLKKFTAVGR